VNQPGLSVSRSHAGAWAKEPLRAPHGAPLHCTLDLEAEAHQAGYPIVAGVDEVGRGALCGPVFAAAVVLADQTDVNGVNDSKQLTAKRRELLSERLRLTTRAWAIGAAEAGEVDALGIVAATHQAMRRAVAGLGLSPDLLLVDGFAIAELPIPQWPVIKGDARSASIAAASIVAKVGRDALMRELDATYPGYGLARNKGYGSQLHRDALDRLGLSPIHRKSFCRQLTLFAAEGAETDAHTPPKDKLR
jgi:ribonuclease HII